MIAALALLLASDPIEITSARRVTDADRVIGTDVTIRCEFPVDNVQTMVAFGLNGEIAGVGNGPLELVDVQGQSAVKFKSLPGTISWDETQPLESRVSYVHLINKLKLGGQRFVAAVDFTYRSDVTTPTRINQADRVSEAKISLFRASDMKNSVVGYIERDRDVRPLIEAKCSALPSGDALNGPDQ